MGFFNKLRKKAQKKFDLGAVVSPELSPFNRGRSVLTGLRNTNRRSNRGLAEIVRRMQEQLRNQQMPPGPATAPSFMPEGMTEDFAKRVRDAGIDLSDTASYLYSPAGQRRGQSLIPMPKISGPNPDYVPPAVAPDMIPNLDLGMPVMPEERMAPPVMNQMQGEPRMMMAGGRDANMVDFLNSDPQQQIFGIETRIGILENQLQEALANNDRQSYDMIVDQINDADAQRINIMNSMNPMNSRMILGESGRTISNRDREIGRTLSNMDREILGESGRTISNFDRATLDDILSDLEKKN